MLWVGACFALFILCLLVVGSGKTMGPYELAVFNSIYGLPAFLVPFFKIVTFLGSTWLLIGVVAGLAIARHFAVATRLALAVGGAVLVSAVLKEFIMRPRPFYMLAAVENRDLPTASYGFPSTHAAVAFAAAVLLIYFVPKSYRFWLLFAAVLAGVSRIYLGVHAPLDVVAGAALGAFFAYIVQLVPRIPRRI